ncbi:MAG: hypothetical protein A2W31_01210 [Planctomycetes bacterium RBG_16_64_10]|nr:MAG: hypothetical protein A2W31_01210 [Planctomycetes bacterium RBG_16_64_10]
MRRACLSSWLARCAPFATAVLWIAVTLAGAPVGAEDALAETTSLKLVPADTGLYVAWLRNKEQAEHVLHSKAFARLQEIPVVQMGWFFLQAQWQSTDNEFIAAARDWVQREENRSLIELLADALSTEVFVYGGEEYASQIGFLMRLNQAMNLAQFQGLATGQAPAAVVVQRVLEIVTEHADNLAIPDTVVGFRLDNTERATAQLTRLEELLGEVLDGHPGLKGRLQRETLGGAEFLTLRLDGSLIPWDALPTDKLAVDAATIERLTAKLKQMKLTISVGVRDNYLLWSIGESNEHLTTPIPDQRLIDRKELAPLRDHAGEPFTSIAYVSEPLMKEISAADRQIDDLVALAENLLPLAELTQAQKEALIRDARELGNDIKRYLPTPGAVLGFTFLSPRGYEGYSYSWARNAPLDGSQPLSILEHVGGRPLMFYVTRGKSSPEDYDLLAKWAERIACHVDQIAAAQLGGPEREMYEKLRPELIALGKRLDRTIRDQFLPAFADRQAALVVDARSRSSQWHAAMPRSEQPLPILELALMHALRDAELYHQGCVECLGLANQLLEVLHSAAPDQVPKVKLPQPESRKLAVGEVRAYPLPPAWGVDAQIAPNMGWSDDVAVLSLVPAQTERLLAETPLEAPPLLSNCQERPLAVAAYCHWAGLIDAAAPWIDYAVDEWLATGATGDDAPNGSPAGGAIKDQIHTGLAILKCLREIASVTYVEQDAQVTRYEWHFQDLE